MAYEQRQTQKRGLGGRLRTRWLVIGAVVAAIAVVVVLVLVMGGGSGGGGGEGGGWG